MSGLPILRKKEWTDVRLDKDYKATYSTVGDGILLARTSGFPTPDGEKKAIGMIDAIVEEAFTPGGAYVQIEDLSDLRRPSFEARQYFIDSMKKRERLARLIFCNPPPLMKIGVKLAIQFNTGRNGARLVDEYSDAVRMALEVLTGLKAREPVTPETSKGAHDAMAQPDWSLELDGLSIRMEIIGRDILHSISSGFGRKEHIEPILELHRRVKHAMEPREGFRYVIANVEDLEGVNRRARRFLMDSLKGWHERRSIRMVVLYGANNHVRAAVNLAGSFTPFTVRTTRDLPEALEQVRAHKKNGGSPGASPDGSDGARRKYVEELLQYLGGINWETDGVGPRAAVDDTHPFHPIFDAIALIKGELDELFRERERAAAALRESEKRLREVMEHSRDILSKRDIRTGEYDYISRSAARLLGYTPEEIVSMGYGEIEKLIHPRDLDRYRSFMETIRNTPPDDAADPAIEYRIKRGDGVYRWFSGAHGIIEDSDGAPRWVIGNDRDITDRKMAELARKESHERFQTIMDSLDAHVYVLDMESHVILSVNKKVRDDFGHDLVGGICWEVFHGKSGPCRSCTNDKLLDAHGAPTGLYVWEGKNPFTGRWYINYDRAVKWVDGRYVRLEISTDITRRKQLEEERIKTEEHLRQSQKLEALGAMAGGIAHNFNNLLMAIQGNLDLALSDLTPGSRAERNIRDAEKASQSAAELSTLMLTYVGQGVFSRRTIDMVEMIKQMMGLLKASISKKAVLRIRGSSDPAFFRGDPSQVRQIIVNLATNAVEAVGDGEGVITLSAGVKHCDQAWFKGQLLKENLPDGDYVYFKVSDTGGGMDKETLGKVFDPFFTTKFTGRGLGLAVVMGIMRGHKGAISLSSEPGRGTVVRVFFPAAPDPPARIETPAPEEPGPPWRGSGSVLLVDDEAMVLSVGKSMLEKLGFRVLTAKDGLEAVEVFLSHARDIVCVVLDMTMPRMDGKECFARLRSIDPGVLVLISSGYTEEQVTRQFVDGQPAEFIQKPFKLKKLTRKIKMILGETGEKASKSDPGAPG